MVRGRCPECEALVEITPTGKPIGDQGTSRWWRLVMHAFNGKVCDGSGKTV